MNVAFIPVRGGSKSIPLKNIKKICGKPLVYWVISAAVGCKAIDKVYVATDSEQIKVTVEKFYMDKVTVIGRSRETATDIASTESAMLEFAHNFEFDNIVLIQATSPLLTYDDLNRGFQTYEKEGTDSVLSVVKQKRFHWALDENENAYPTNYDVYARPRRQEFDGYYVENGAFYITSRKRLLASGNRVSGNIRLTEMNEDTFFEIDEPGDWVIIEALMKKNGFSDSSKKIINYKNIKMFLTDCDGCLTDGGMYYSENGDELKKFNTRDGKAFELLRQKGILTGIITSEDVELVRRRAAKLKLDIVECGTHDKLNTIKRLAAQHNLTLDQIAYVGDDINDLDAIKNVGLGCSVANGIKAVRDAADYVSELPGGMGAIREIVQILI